MNFNTLYRASFYAMLVSASFVLSIDVLDNRSAIIYPFAVSIAAVLAFFTVDRSPDMGISALLADLLALTVTALAVVEWRADETQLVLALGHWLIYFTLIYMFRKKSAGGDEVMFRLGLFQVLVGTVLSESEMTGTILFLWAILTLWVLGLMNLQREAVRAHTINGPVKNQVPLRELYPGLLNLPFMLSTLRVTLTTLALGGVIFLAMPRRLSMAKSEGKEIGGQHLTGFDEEIQLGQMGEILENDTVVMSVETFDEKGKKIMPPSEPLWRGVTMARYEKGRWKRQRDPGDGTFPTAYRRSSSAPDLSRPQGFFRQQIKLESTDTKALFGIRPMTEISVARGIQPAVNAIDGTIFRGDPKPGSYDYEVVSLRDTESPQLGETAPGPVMELRLKEFPAEIRLKIQAIAEDVFARSVPAESRGDIRVKAKALEEYLRDSGAFSYTLKLDSDDRNIDPVLDFLVNRKQGHCEYFASALALLLRSVEIPSRVVNGFKGGDWNDLAGVMTVRQKHAHSWVEAYLGLVPGSERSPRWLTLDPTPGNEREASVARVGGFRGNFRQFTDFVRFIWLFYIVGYNSERQNALLYGPIRSLIREAKDGFSIMGQWFQRNYAKGFTLLHFPDAKSFFSLRGFLVTFIPLVILVGLVRLGAWIWRRLWLRFGGPVDEGDPLAPAAAQYLRLANLLAELGLERKLHQTQEEFARSASTVLRNRNELTKAVADVPGLVVDAFYRVRFGEMDLPSETTGSIELRLNALENSLKVQAEA